METPRKPALHHAITRCDTISHQVGFLTIAGNSLEKTCYLASPDGSAGSSGAGF